MVLIKRYGPDGFVFFTNLESRKGSEIKDNPVAAMCFYWEQISWQVRVEGDVVPVSEEEADAYYASRPLKSRIGAWASKQSRPLRNRASFLAEIAQQTAQFAGKPPPRPPHWSGFQLNPSRFEFWRQGEFRLHHRWQFERATEDKWSRSQLYP